MDTILSGLGMTSPVVAAPMAGGPGTPALVTAAAAAGSLGFLAAGYLTADVLAGQIAAVRGGPFGVNLFAPNPVPVDPAEFAGYAAALDPLARRYGLDLTDRRPVEDDDAWLAKLDLLRRDPVPVVGFTFGIPDVAVIRSLQRAGTVVAQTVTSVEEARAADEAGADLLVVQSTEAGGHWGTLTPRQPPPARPLLELVSSVAGVTARPLLAAGGLTSAGQLGAALGAGAAAALVGTALLRSDESGASAVHRAALADPERGDTVVTRAFTGRPARTLPNRFVTAYDAIAPFGYPALHHLTGELRRAATAAGDPESVNLWAGVGYRQAGTGPAGEILVRLAASS